LLNYYENGKFKREECEFTCHFSSPFFFTSHSQVKAKAKEHAAHSREAREPDHSFLSSKHAELVSQMVTP